MAINKLRIFKIQAESMRKSLSGNSEKDKSHSINQQIADRFNDILKEIREGEPEASEFLPSPITTTGDNKILGIADVSYMDLEILLDQLIATLSEIERNV